MHDHHTPGDEASQVISSARAAEHAIQQLCRTTLTRPSMTPAEVDIVLGHLADAAAALPQAARQLGDILKQAKDDYVLEMDSLTKTQDPDHAVETARIHLDALHEPALDLLHQLEAARLETAHISTSATPRDAKRERPSTTPSVRRPEDRRPRAAGGGGTGPGVPR